MITQRISHLLQYGVSVVVGTADDDHRPECTRGLGVRRLDDGITLSLFLLKTTSARTLENLRSNGRIALVLSRPADSQAIQVKGRVQEIREALNPVELEAQNLWMKKFTEEVVAAGVSDAAARTVVTNPCVAVDIRVESVFVTTPGPQAGTEL